MPRPADEPAFTPEHPPGDAKFCTLCGQSKSIEEFHLDHTTHDGRKSSCKACRAEQHAEQTESKIDPRLAKLEEAGLEALDLFSSGGSFNPHTQELIDGFMRFLGGHYGLVKLTMGHYHSAKPGSAERGKTLDKIFRLIAAEDKQDGTLDKLDRKQLEALVVSIGSKAGMLPSPEQPLSLDSPDTVNAVVSKKGKTP